MYVRRKCYSILEDIDGEEKLFSVNEIEDVNDIEDIYDEERYFSDDERGGMSTAAKVGLGTAAGLGSLAGLTYAAKKGKLGSKAKGLYDQAAKKGKDIFESIKGKFGKKEVAEAQEKKGLGTGAKAGIGLAAIAAAVGLSRTKFVQALKGKLGAKAKAMAEKAMAKINPSIEKMRGDTNISNGLEKVLQKVDGKSPLQIPYNPLPVEYRSTPKDKIVKDMVEAYKKRHGKG